MRTALLFRAAALPCRPARLHIIAHVDVHVHVCCLCGACSPSCRTARQLLRGWKGRAVDVCATPAAGWACQVRLGHLARQLQVRNRAFFRPNAFFIGPSVSFIGELASRPVPWHTSEARVGTQAGDAPPTEAPLRPMCWIL